MAGLFLWLPVEVVIVVEVFVFSLILKMRIAKFNGDFLGLPENWGIGKSLENLETWNLIFGIWKLIFRILSF